MSQNHSDDLLVGVLSDTHGQCARVHQAARIFRTLGIRQVFHCGDIGSLQVIHALAEFSMAYVAGNTDWDLDRLSGEIQATGGRFDPLWLEAQAGGARFAMTHGHDPACLQRLIESGNYAYVLHGHTHVFRDECAGPTRIVNPGALHRAWPVTVATIDLKTREVNQIRLAENPA